jgi:aspartate/methionine/tyrosine aminotransferase
VAVDGPDALVHEAMTRLELICDTYLSVSTPVQVAAAELIAAGHGPRSAVQARTRANYARLRALSAAHPSVNVLQADAGWSAVIRVAARGTEEEIVLRILEADGVLVHPGFFFDFAHEAYLVVSLLPDEEAFAEGIRRVLERVDG